MAYHLEGRLLEVCNCRVLCPCWIGEDPDFGTCDTIVAWHFDKGTIDGVDVAGRTIAMIAHVPGNILQGNWKAAVYLDEQRDAGAGSRRSSASTPASSAARWPTSPSWSARSCRSRRCRSRSTCTAATARSRSATRGYAELEPYKNATGATTTLADTVFSTVPGAPVFVGKAPRYRSKNAKLGIDLDLKGHNALQSTFVFDA